MSGKISWTNAKAACIADGGSLASILDKDTNDFLTSLTEVYTWVGGYLDDQNVWRWTDGSEWSYTNWGPGQPVDDGSQNHLAINHGGVGLWDDGVVDVWAARGYMCQRQKEQGLLFDKINLMKTFALLFPEGRLTPTHSCQPDHTFDITLFPLSFSYAKFFVDL